jgi:hypothetical protein
MANSTDIERLNYYEGEFLGAADFEAEQEYHREMRRRHNIGQHTWGIVSGLDLVQIPNGAQTPNNLPEVDIYVQPGMAVDGFGREIVVLNKAQLTQDFFAPYFDPNPAAPPIPMYVWISYAQVMLQPPADACTRMNQPNAFGRVQETFALTVTPDPKGPTDDLIAVDGKSTTPPVQPWSSPPPPPPQPGDILLPYDDSVPYQEFSADDSTVNWHVAIGRVFWDPHNGVFVQQPDSWPAVGRQYAGSVTSAIFSPGDSLVIRDRFAPYPLPQDPQAKDLGQYYGGTSVKLAGSLSVDRLLKAAQNILIDGAPDPANKDVSPLTIKPAGNNQELIQFRDPNGVEKWLVCENPNGNNLGLHIGEIPPEGQAPGVTRVFIQSTLPGSATLPSPVNVGIGTSAPRNPLAVRAQGAWEELLSFEDPAGNTNWHLNQNPQGLNVKRGLNFCETGKSDFRLFLQTGGNVGIGTGTPAASLDVAGGLLHVGGTASPVVTSQGAYLGWNALTGGTGETDFINNRGGGAGGFAFMDAPLSGSPITTLMVITGGGNVGIGTITPSARLEVNGTVKFAGKSLVQIYRLYNSATKDHLYTPSVAERATAMASGYVDETGPASSFFAFV